MSAAHAADTTVSNILTDLADASHKAIVVDSPPGAGKSTLVVKAAGQLARDGTQRMIVAQTNEQVDDLIARLAAAHPDLPIGRLSAQDYRPSDRIALPNVRAAAKVDDLADRTILIGTAAKWATLTEGTWEHAIVDEAYQMRSEMLLRIAGRFDRGLFVGDPGQLDPFATVESDRWAGLDWDPTRSAVPVMLANNRDRHIPIHRLPVSWRLPTSAADVISAAFYPFTPFTAGTDPGTRQLTYVTHGLRTPVDRCLDEAADHGWALYELPARNTLRTDREAVSAIASLAVRILERGATATSEQGTHPVTADRLAIGTAHRDQAEAIRLALRGTLAEPVTVDTANRLQGREYDITIVLHPLSGRRDASSFHLEAGRLCVLTSRHRHACIVVARAGIAELLDAYPSTEPVHLGVPVKFPDGWEANQSILSYLEPHRISM
ncbi:AAA domain-containing protein [Nocardia caishijiensis]|uniref:AAA domain-containing protein n=1 Tax=Nocardia caishijiensis TaxID=184756 RepID=A0ABQ6YH05_9NOCA|nr:AAA domain-containing protein [Nocardia caishijiensis]KAF0842565.1 AAA domain-containing protein [Nocardia caishijiensis]